MNDSFLEDLDLVPKIAKNSSQINNKYVTTRKVLSPPTNSRTNGPELKQNITTRKVLVATNERTRNDFNSDLKQDKIISSSTGNIPKLKVNNRRSGSQEPKKSTEEKTKPLSSTPKSERRSQGEENLMKPVENQLKTEEFKAKPQDVKALSKAQDSKKPAKDKRRSAGTSSTGSSHYIDASSKENTRPSTDSCSSRESGSQAELKRDLNRRTSDGASSRKSDLFERTDPVMFLSAIKDLVSRYTEQETVKVLRAMQNLHINSQSNLIKHLMLQTDELVKELNLHKNSDNVKSLIEENERMREDIFILRARNEVLQKKVDEIALIKEENISLKMKLKELQQ